MWISIWEPELKGSRLKTFWDSKAISTVQGQNDRWFKWISEARTPRVKFWLCKCRQPQERGKEKSAWQRMWLQGGELGLQRDMNQRWKKLNRTLVKNNGHQKVLTIMKLLVSGQFRSQGNTGKAALQLGKGNDSHTKGNYYLMNLYLQTRLLAKIYFSLSEPIPKGSCGHSRMCKEQEKNWVVQHARVPSWGWTRQSAFTVQLAYCKQVLLLFSAMFFTFLCFLLVMSLFKIAPRCSVEVLSSVPQSKKAVVCLMEKIPESDELSPGMSSMLTNQQYVLKTASLNRNLHKRGLCIDHLTEIWPEAHKNKTL